MLRLPVLLAKLKIFIKGETIVDLTRSSISFKQPVDVTNAIMVTSDLAMRPDVIAKVAYGDSGMLDFILKFNEISNPFSIQEGDLLFIPDMEDMKRCFVKIPPEIYPSLNPSNAITGSSPFVSVKDLSNKDKNRLKYLQQIATDAVVTTNAALPGAAESKIRNGVVVFGEDNCKQKCAETISRVKLKEKLLQKRIFQNPATN